MKALVLFCLIVSFCLSGCEDKSDPPAEEQSDAGAHFDRVSPTPGDVKKANQQLRKIKKGVQDQADDRSGRIDGKIETE